MQTATKPKNIAPSSDNGHYVHGAKNVINLDKVNETFRVEGASRLVTKNHTTLEMTEDCLITCQQVFDPFKQAFTRARD